MPEGHVKAFISDGQRLPPRPNDCGTRILPFLKLSLQTTGVGSDWRLFGWAACEPKTDIRPSVDTAVKESRERVRAAIKNSDFQFPQKRITINLAPADIRKEGSIYDLAIAAGILRASMFIENENLESYAFLGELSLDGTVKGIKGVLPMCLSLKQNG